MVAWPPALSTAAPTGSDRVNVLFIAIDDLNDWVGFLRGHPQAKTPNMDRLAARGTVFANAHCAAPLCCPSRAAVFSGREPFNSGIYENGDNIAHIAPELVLLPTQMKAHGYRTWGAGKLLHRKRPDLYDKYFKPEQRWSPFTSSDQVKYAPEELPSKGTDNPRHMIDMGPGRPPVILPLNGMPSDRRPHDPGGESFDWGPLDVPDSAMGDVQIVDWAIERLSEKSAQPFFLAVGFYRPHIPLWAPTKYFDPFPSESTVLPPFLEDDLDDLGPLAREIATTPETAGAHATVLQHDQWAPAVAAYLACVYFVDTQIGRLLDALEASGQDRTTAVVIWGDHGWHLGEKQHWGKWTGWERSTHVPLLIVPPSSDRDRYTGGRSTREPVSLVDLYPTVLELADVPPPATGLDGESLVPLLRAPDLATGRAVISTFRGEHFSIGDKRWRYIRYADGSEELYDHSSDPNEWTNLAADPARNAVKARLAQLVPKEPQPSRQAREAIKEIAERANRSQLARPWKEEDRNWIRATYYTGVMAMYRATGDNDWLTQAESWAEKHDWQVGNERSGANVLTCVQTYLQLCEQQERAKPIQQVVQWLNSGRPNTPSGADAWYLEGGRRYADSLYVGPPALAMLAKATGEQKYLRCMDAMFWDVHRELFDQDAGLFYRDNRFRAKPGDVPVSATEQLEHRKTWVHTITPNGKKVFWSRGNGWVFAGIARILAYLPEDYPTRPRYVALFQQMAQSLSSRQQTDGAWRMNLDDPDQYAISEASGTGFFTYGFAWGINHGFFDREEYQDVAMRGWKRLTKMVSPEGKVQWGQPVGGSPFDIRREDSHEYVTGTFLLAASEIFRLVTTGHAGEEGRQ